jgi:alpha-ketoglutarate-dependent taurine dioxygenase
MSSAAIASNSAALPLVLTPAEVPVAAPTALAAWVRATLPLLRPQLWRHGAILFRGFGFTDLTDFEVFVREFTPELQHYVGGASQRTHVAGKVYTSTDMAAHYPIGQHHEGSYLREMPRIVGFFCRVPATSGGQTPLADGRRVLARIPVAVREKFDRLEVLYVNNLPNRFGIGKSWQAQFENDDRATVEQVLRADGYEFVWKPDGALRTMLRCPAVRVHADTGAAAWVTQADYWHPSGLPPETRARLARTLPESEFPTNATYGDGTPLDEADLALIRDAIRAETVQFDWQAGDVLICDNWLVSHGRRPYEGERKVFVALG